MADERLVARMDLEYGDDDIGSLEEEEHATRGHAAWGSGDLRLQKVLGAYEHNHQNGRSVVRRPCMLWCAVGDVHRGQPLRTGSYSIV